MDQPVTPTSPTDAVIELRGQTFALLPERVAYWIAQKTLLASDLHWGKTEIFHHFGSPIPDGVLRDDLARLSRAITRTQARRLLILGDLVHAPKGLTPMVKGVISEWRELQPDLQIELILGNHDRGLKLDDGWRIQSRAQDIEESDFIFTHDAQRATEGKFTWSGHVHPVFRATSRADSLRLPCFEIRKQLGFLPAFSSFTGGVEVRSRTSRVFAVTETHVVQVR